MTDFMSKAHALRNAVNWNSNSSVEVIAEALREEYERGLEDAARVAEGEPYKDHYRTWPWQLPRKGYGKGNYRNEDEIVIHSDKIATAIRQMKEVGHE